MIRASFSQERMTYIPEESRVIYQSKNGKQEKVFDALESPIKLDFLHVFRKNLLLRD